MRSRIIVTLALIALATGGLIAAARPNATAPSDAAPITAEATSPATVPGAIEVSGTSATVAGPSGEVWSGPARPPLSGTSVRNSVLEGRRDASDARLAGHFVSRSSCDYAFTDSGFAGSCWASQVLTNDGGAWEGTGMATIAWTDATMALTLVEDYLMLGRGAYEGLAHRGRGTCVPGGAHLECTWSGVIEPAFAPAEIETDLAIRTTHWSGTWRPTEVVEPDEGRIGTFGDRCSRPAFALHHTVTEGFDTYLGPITATMTYCWYRTFATEVIGTIEVADGSSLTFVSDQITMGTKAPGNWERNALAITGGTGRFTGATGGGTLWGEVADIEAVLAGADAPRAWMDLAIVVRPSATVTRP